MFKWILYQRSESLPRKVNRENACEPASLSEELASYTGDCVKFHSMLSALHILIAVKDNDCPSLVCPRACVQCAQQPCHLLEDLLDEVLESRDILRIRLHVLVVAVLSPQRLHWIQRCCMQRPPRRDVHNIIPHPL